MVTNTERAPDLRSRSQRAKTWRAKFRLGPGRSNPEGPLPYFHLGLRLLRQSRANTTSSNDMWLGSLRATLWSVWDPQESAVTVRWMDFSRFLGWFPMLLCEALSIKHGRQPSRKIERWFTSKLVDSFLEQNGSPVKEWISEMKLYDIWYCNKMAISWSKEINISIANAKLGSDSRLYCWLIMVKLNG